MRTVWVRVCLITLVGSFLAHSLLSAPARVAAQVFTCSRMIGFSQTRDFYPVFEAQVDGSRWEGLVIGGASIDYWADPNYAGWLAPVTSPCASGSGNPDWVVLHVAARPGQKSAKTVDWYKQHITAAVANVRSKYPAVQRIDLMPIIGGPPSTRSVRSPSMAEPARSGHPSRTRWSMRRSRNWSAGTFGPRFLRRSLPARSTGISPGT